MPAVPRGVLVRIAPLWVVGVVLISLQGYRPKAAQTPVLHRGFHFLAFGATALLMLFIAQTPRQRLLAAFGVMGLGIAIETAQHCIFGTPLEWWDVRDNALAVAVVWLMVRAVRVRACM